MRIHTQAGGIRDKFPVYIFNEDGSLFKRASDVEIAGLLIEASREQIRQAIVKKRLLNGYYVSKEDYFNNINSKLM